MPNGNSSTGYEVRGTVGRVVAFLLPLTSFLFPLAAHAICPVCTVAVAGGVGLSRWLGIDDTVSGIWIGGLTVSLTFWTDSWLESKKFKISGRLFAVLVVYIALIVLPLYWMDVTGHPFNRMWGVDKLMLGMVFGGIVFALAVTAYDALKRRNNGHAWFPFQKVVMPVGALAVVSAIFYFIT